MPKLGLEPIRRRQLIEATIASIHEDGLADTTVSRISARAGMSPGIVHHYFINKDDLLEATLRTLGGQVREVTRLRLGEATDPRERLCAIIGSWLAPEQLTPAAVAAWLSFWAQGRKQPRLARVQRAIICRLDSSLRHELKQLLPTIDAVRVAEGLSTLLEGLWLRAALSPYGLETERAMQIAIDYLDLQLARRREPQPA
jgi:TetR/AcrR family transcriptional regulator, transcriptional repressor of bet genes